MSIGNAKKMFEQNDTLADSISRSLNTLDSLQILCDADDDSSETILKIVKTLNDYHRSLLYHPTILSHALFAKLRVRYRLLLKARRRRGYSSSECGQQEALFELGAFLSRLSIGIHDENVEIMKQIFFNKSFIDEFVDCLNVIITGQEDSLLVVNITSIVSIFSRLQLRKTSDIFNDPIHKQFIDAIVQYLCSIDFKKEMMTPNVNVNYRSLIKNCLHYLVDFEGEQRHHLHATVCQAQLRPFNEWLPNQTSSFTNYLSTEVVTIIDYMATILSTCLINNILTEEELNIYLALFETFINIILSSKESENYFLTSIMIKHSYTFAINNPVCRNRLPEGIIPLLNELIDDIIETIDNDDDETMLNACRLLLLFGSFHKINVRKVMFILINSLPTMIINSKPAEASEILDTLKSLLLFSGNVSKKELRKVKHLDILRQCATSYNLFNFDIRQKALDLFYSVVSIPGQYNDNDIHSLLRQSFASDAIIEQCHDMYDWTLKNWEQQSTKDSDTVLIPIIIQEYDSMKTNVSVKKHQEKRRRQNQIRIAKRNREDAIIVCIYDITTTDKNELNTIQWHLESIRYTVRHFDVSKNTSALLDFILSHQTEQMFILVDAACLHLISDQLFCIPHASSFVFSYNTTANIPFVLFSSLDCQSCITSLANDVEQKTVLTAEFLFYESKQTLSTYDLIASSVHFIWHRLLIEAVTNMSIGNHQEFVTALQHWYSTNATALCEINYFQMTYTSKTSELWYNTNKSTIIQRILQNAFKNADMETIYFARSVIIDISRKFLSVAPLSTDVRHVFTCSLMNRSKTNFIFDQRDTLIMPIGYLIGHVDRQKILSYLERLSNENFEKTLFEIDISNDVPVLSLGTDGVLFNIGVVFRIVHVSHDPISQIYHIRLCTISNTGVGEPLIDSIIQLREQVGETTERPILFGSLLAQMNCVRSAMNYFLFYNNHDPDNKVMEIYTLAELGRISLRCNQLIDAEKFFLYACDLYKQNKPVIKDSVIGRIRIDLVLVLVRQGRTNEANALCQETLLFLCDSLQPLSVTLLNVAQGRVCLCGVTDELAYATFDNLYHDYEQKNYYCQHPTLIGGNAIDVGDMYREKNSLSITHKCYMFAYFICEHNLPSIHPLTLATLHRISQLLDQMSSVTEIEKKLADIWQSMSNDNANSQEKKILVDTTRNLALFYVNKGEHSKARRWFEMCLSVYRRQWPSNEQYIHQCQAYILKHQLGLQNMMTSIEIRKEKNFLQLNDIVLSMEYEHLTTKHLLQRTTNEENHRWDQAMTNFKHNIEVDSGIVSRQLVVWIESDLQILNNDTQMYQAINNSPYVSFHTFEDAESAIFFLMYNYQFTHVQIVVSNNVADDFFESQELARLQTEFCLTFCVFVLDADETEEIDRYNQYLTYLQCGRKCWLDEREHDERCLIMSKDRNLCQEFCLRKDTLGMTISMIIRLVDIGGFRRILETQIDDQRHKILLIDDDHHHIDFVGYMSGYGITVPKVFNHLRFPQPLYMSKNDVQIAALVMFGRRHNLTDNQIVIICRYFSTGNCIRSVTLIKYLVRLWSLESPIYFYRLVNTALAECCVEDIHYLRYIIYDYLEMFYGKSVPYFTGTLYRGISTTDENIALLMSLEGQKIYFVCFTATSKNRARAQVGGNVLFEIETLSKESQNAQKLHSNADISTVSQFPEEEEVLYAPLTTFLLVSVVRNADYQGIEHYTVKLRELGGGSFLSMLHIDKLQRMPNASPFLPGTDHWQIKINPDEQNSLRFWQTSFDKTT